MRQKAIAHRNYNKQCPRGHSSFMVVLAVWEPWTRNLKVWDPFCLFHCLIWGSPASSLLFLSFLSSESASAWSHKCLWNGIRSHLTYHQLYVPFHPFSTHKSVDKNHLLACDGPYAWQPSMNEGKLPTSGARLGGAPFMCSESSNTTW